MTKIFILCFILSAIFSFFSCGSFGPKLFTEQEWSENYSLSDGVKSTSPEMIDGNKDTIGKMLFPDDFYRGGMRALPSAEVVITFPEKKSISRIVIYADNLPDLRILSNSGMINAKDDWRLVKEITNNKLKEIEIRTSIQTDKIAIRAKGITPIESTETSRVLGGVVVSRKVFEPEIREVEIYGYKQKSDKNNLWN